MNFIVASRHTRKMFRFLFVLCVINQYRGKEEKLLIYPWVTTLTEIASQTQPSKKEKYMTFSLILILLLIEINH